MRAQLLAFTFLAAVTVPAFAADAPTNTFLSAKEIAGLIEARRDGKHNYYRIQAGKLPQCQSLLQGVVVGGDGNSAANQSWGDLISGISAQPSSEVGSAPAADAARSLLGPAGGGVITAVALVALLGLGVAGYALLRSLLA